MRFILEIQSCLQCDLPHYQYLTSNFNRTIQQTGNKKKLPQPDKGHLKKTLLTTYLIKNLNVFSVKLKLGQGCAF